METLLNANAMNHYLLLLLFLSLCVILRGVTSLGINYGQVGNDLPQPEKVLELLNSLRVKRARIYDTNPRVLTAFANSDIELIVTVENLMLPVLVNPQQALQWVNSHIKPYFPATKITGIAVGNEVFTDDDSSTLIRYLVPAMISIQGALAQLGLDKFIQVSTPNSLSVLSESYPPSAGKFDGEVSGVMSQLLSFLSSTKSPFWINAYPYFAYKDNPNKIPLNYVLFNPNPGMFDPYTKLHYDNMLYAQVDAVIFAMARLGYNGIEVRVSETGWPSKGDVDEIGATPENAAMYNRNLVRRQLGNEGTPLRPNVRLEVFLFGLFNEDLKPGPTSERNYGLFHPDETMVYNAGFAAASALTSTSTTTPSSSTVMSIASSAPKAGKKGSKCLVYWMFFYLLTLQVIMRRPH